MEFGRSLCSGIYYFPTGFSMQRNKYPVDHDVSKALLHDDLRAVVGHFCFGIHNRVLYPSIYASMLREPVERVISLFHHLKWVGDIPQDTTLEKFMDDEKIPESSNDQVYRIAGLHRTPNNQQTALKTNKD